LSKIKIHFPKKHDNSIKRGRRYRRKVIKNEAQIRIYINKLKDIPIYLNAINHNKFIIGNQWSRVLMIQKSIQHIHNIKFKSEHWKHYTDCFPEKNTVFALSIPPAAHYDSEDLYAGNFNTDCLYDVKFYQEMSKKYIENHRYVILSSPSATIENICLLIVEHIATLTTHITKSGVVI
jgi:hypothetical protein